MWTQHWKQVRIPTPTSSLWPLYKFPFSAAREMRYELQRMRQTALGLEDSMARLVQKHSTTSVLSNERRVNDIISEINAINDDLSSNAITLLGILHPLLSFYFVLFLFILLSLQGLL